MKYTGSTHAVVTLALGERHSSFLRSDAERHDEAMRGGVHLAGSLHRVSVGLMAVLLLVGTMACGGDAASSPTSPTVASSSFCDAFKDASQSDLTLTSKAAWDQRLVITTTLVNLAPPEQQANARVYLQLVTERYQLVAQYNYVSVQQLPADVRNQFIATHQSQQDQSNIFIAYAQSTCNI